MNHISPNGQQNSGRISVHVIGPHHDRIIMADSVGHFNYKFARLADMSFNTTQTYFIEVYSPSFKFPKYMLEITPEKDLSYYPMNIGSRFDDDIQPQNDLPITMRTHEARDYFTVDLSIVFM